MGGPRFFGQSPSQSRAKVLVLTTVINNNKNPCVGKTKLGTRAAGCCAFIASMPISTYGVEAPTARAHGARFKRYVGVLIQPL